MLEFVRRGIKNKNPQTSRLLPISAQGAKNKNPQFNFQSDF